MDHENLCPICVEPRWHACKHPDCPTRQLAGTAANLPSDFVPTAPSLARKGDDMTTAASIKRQPPDLQSLNLRASASHLPAKGDEP